MYLDFADPFSTIFDRHYRTRDYRIDSTDEAVTIELDLPGCVKDNCEIKIKDRLLDVQAKIRDQDLTWSFRLGKQLEANSVEAALENGILSISIPKTPEAKPRQIEIR